MKRLFSTVILSLVALNVLADEELAIKEMLNDFLTYNDQLEQHQKFWAEDLVYTSSSGKRFGKSIIIKGMEEAKKAQNASSDSADSATATYSAKDIDIRLYGDTAILAFRLIAHYEAKEMPTKEFFNTGTLVKRNDNWKVVAWQATRI